MKAETDLNGSYINDALQCSTLDISVGKEDLEQPAGASKGSNEYIRKYGVEDCIKKKTIT